MNPAGAAAEDQALHFLQQRGLILVERNYHCRFGEIDLIMRDGKTLVFVEVKARSGSGFGGSWRGHRNGHYAPLPSSGTARVSSVS